MELGQANPKFPLPLPFPLTGYRCRLRYGVFRRYLEAANARVLLYELRLKTQDYASNDYNLLIALCELIQYSDSALIEMD